MTEDHKQEDSRAHWATVPRALLEGFAIVGALIIIEGCLWAFDRPTSPTQKREFLQALGVLLAALVGLGGLYFMQVLAAYVRQRTGLETEDLSEADLSMADLSRTNLREANLSGANLRAAILLRTDLRRATLRRADLQRVLMSNATLMGADLREANLSGANLRAAILLRTDLRRATLRRADLQRVLMSNATLMGADLREANLSMANLSGVNLRQADLSRANLSGAFGWTEAQFRAASSLEGATMPNGQKYEEWLKDKQDRGEDGGGRERP
jgi:uncharacterized protein YjbI with pentapeptide repeats